MRLDLGIAEQARALAASVLAGGAAGVLYDLCRSLRRRISSGLFHALCDGLFVLVCGCGLLLLALALGHGEERAFVFLGALGGFGLYMWALSPAILPIFGLFSAVLIRILGFLSLPLNIIHGFWKKYQIFVKKLFSILKDWYKIRGNNGDRLAEDTTAAVGGEYYEAKAHRYLYENHYHSASDLRRDHAGGPPGED